LRPETRLNITNAMSKFPAEAGGRVRVAGFWRRSLAAALDGLLLLPLVLLFGGVTSALAGHALPRLAELGFGYVVHLAVDGGLAGRVALAVAVVVALLYETLFLSTTGQTPGMRLVGLRVIDAWGEPPSVTRTLWRIVGLALSIALFCGGYLWIAFSREKRGLHDLIAGTYVIRARVAPAMAAMGTVAS
jgi:uncharacterized RDD family membrane protein YckC